MVQFKCPEKIDYVLIESKLMYHDIKNETLRIIKLLGILRIFHLFRVAQTEPSVAMDQHSLNNSKYLLMNEEEEYIQNYAYDCKS